MPCQALCRLIIRLCREGPDTGDGQVGQEGVAMPGETPIWGTGAIRRWVDLLDRAEALIGDADHENPLAQRIAGRALASLFLYEHQMTPRARRACEYVWRRDRCGQLLPEWLSRQEWERCRCRRCLLERTHGRSSVIPLASKVAIESTHTTQAA
jgi:hypothetical protein